MNQVMQDVWSVIRSRHCEECGIWLCAPDHFGLVCTICRAVWPDLRSEIGSALMRERCSVPLAWTGFRLQGNDFLEQELKSLKYEGRPFKGVVWGRWLAEGFSGEMRPDPNQYVLVPIPLHWRKKWVRGYNQSYFIAKGVSMVWGLPMSNGLLKRYHHGKSLTTMNRQQRQNALNSVFSIRVGASPPKQKVILVDDVLTSGATLRAGIQEFTRAGMPVAGVITLALA